jgi:hypothetical protein
MWYWKSRVLPEGTVTTWFKMATSPFDLRDFVSIYKYDPPCPDAGIVLPEYVSPDCLVQSNWSDALSFSHSPPQVAEDSKVHGSVVFMAGTTVSVPGHCIVGYGVGFAVGYTGTNNPWVNKKHSARAHEGLQPDPGTVRHAGSPDERPKEASCIVAVTFNFNVNLQSV